jgi:hypothetical protein
MSFDVESYISSILRWSFRILSRILRIISWIIIAFFACLFGVLAAAGQIPLGPHFKIAIVGAAVAGILMTLASILAIQLIPKLSLLSEWLKKVGRLHWPQIPSLGLLAKRIIAAVLLTALLSLMAFGTFWIYGESGRIASKADMARQEFEVSLYGTGFEEAQVNRTLSELHEAHEDLIREMPKQIREDPISIYLFRDLRAYQTFTDNPRALGSVQCDPSGTLLAIPLEEIPPLFSEDESRTPVHEMVHALMCQALETEAFHFTQRWFHEGMAQLYESDGAGKFNATMNRIAVWLERDDLMDAQSFCSASTWASQAEMALFYRTSMEFVRTLESQHGREKLIGVIQNVQAGRTLEESLRHQLGGTCDELYVQWLASW